MKRRGLSFLITLALCLNLSPVWVLAAGSLPETPWTLDSNYSFNDTYEVSTPYVIDTSGYTLTGTNTTVLRVTKTGALDLKGTVVSKGGAGVEVLSGGTLRITEQADIQGQSYALNIAAGAAVKLSAGKYVGKQAAIQVADGDFSALLAPGCAYFDEKDKPILPTDTATLRLARTLFVKQCTDHTRIYAADEGSPTHTWTCQYCGTKETEACTFDFGADGQACCEQCGRSITIAVDETNLGDLIYNGSDQSANVTLKVSLEDGTTLTENKDYSVSYSTRTNVGEITVTVTGLTFNGTFIKTYTVNPNKPTLKWDSGNCVVDYDSEGQPVNSTKLPHITITPQGTNNEDLHLQIKYSYRKDGTKDEFVGGLPTNAGSYEVKAYIPESQNYKEAETDPCLKLTINKINALLEAPKPTLPTYDRESHALVTAGRVQNGAVIEYAREENGPYTADIPTEINAGDYHVWYRVTADTNNYNVISETEVAGVKINRKSITPKITVTDPSYVYDGAQKNPTITVKDDLIVIEENQYTITWKDEKNNTVTELRNIGTYTATIQSVLNGNYTFTKTATVEIVAADQDALKITGKRDHVYYGDVFTLDTAGGTGNGTVTWSITPNNTSTAIGEKTGELTVKNTGQFTVKAEREVPNHGTVRDTWIFTVKPKPVTAVVTVTPKGYDGTTTATVTAEVKASDLVNSADSFTLTAPTGTYDDPNAGTNKTVTLDDTSATKADGSGKYTVSYPAAARGDINPRAVTVTVTLSGNDLKQDANGWYYEYDGADKTPDVSVTGTDNAYSAPLAAGDYTVNYSNNKSAGTATVTVTEKAGGNYTFNHVMVNFEIRKGASAVLVSPPQANDLTYTGEPQNLVNGGSATGGTVVYSSTGAADSYSETIPQETAAGTYIVYYKVKGDANHTDTAPGQIPVTIKPREFTPNITLSPTSYVYDGTEKKPGVKVEDGTTTIATSEYSVSYRDNVNAGTATVIVSDNNGGNYIVNGTAAFKITKAAPTVTAPAGKTGLQYNGESQDLVTAGVCHQGTVLYSVDDGNFYPAIPTAVAVGEYKIQYKVLGDANYSDIAPVTLADKVVIAKNTVKNPAISLSSDRFPYTGTQQKPVITVCDDRGCLIPDYEYTVTITGTKSNNMIDVDTYTVTITEAASSNYVIQSNNTRTFEIIPADEEAISITGTRAQVFYGDVLHLGTTGGTGNGTVKWTVSGGGTISENGGLLTVEAVGGPFTVTATRTKDGNHSPVSATWEFSAAKKPVTAVLTGVDKVFDGNTVATVKAKVDAADLVVGDTFSIPDLTGTFDNANAGTNKTVTITGSAPVISDQKAANYEISYPATTTASITPKTASAVGVTVKTGLAYTGDPQVLVNAGSAAGGTIAYSTDGVNYSFNLPTGTDAGNYTVWYKAVASDGNHKDSAAQKVTALIAQNKNPPSVTCTPGTFRYDGTEKTPTVTVRDSTGRIIPEKEYTVEFPAPRIEKGTYSVTVKDIQNSGNYEFPSPATGTFKIVASDQKPLTIITDIVGSVHYGDTFRLTATGGSGSGAIVWSVAGTAATISSSGVVTVTDTGNFTVSAYREGAGGYDKSNKDSVLFTAVAKPVTATVTASDKVYDGKRDAQLTVTVNSSDLVSSGDDSTFTATGYFTDENVGSGKTVIIGSLTGLSTKYAISGPATTTASITPKTASATIVAKNDLTYNGNSQELVDVRKFEGGTIEYSTDGSSYSSDIPTGTNADSYTVWYKVVADSGNYTDSEPVELGNVKIEKATPSVISNPVAFGTAGQNLSDITLDSGTVTGVSGSSISGTFTWRNSDQMLAAGTSQQEVTFTPTDTNYNSITFNVTVNVADNSGGTGTGGGSSSDAVSNSTQTTVRNGTANTVLSAADGNRLVKEAAANQSQNIVIKPEITAEVTKAQVSIPASTLSQIRDETTAALTVSAPIADVTIPHAALDTLSRAGGTVDVVTEQADQAVVLTLTAGGKKVEDVPGGVTLTVPAEDAGPGTVAVLVHDDGSRETIRKSVARDGEVSVPLSGSAAVEIVDNSKEFDDVPAGSWAADAVAFASAHELFSGTGEAAFSPDQPMSRGMLATVLYNLEGSPAQDGTAEFSDVSGGAWYADGVAWAAENGITTGYGDGQFGPGDSVTREQFAVMLWKYAGSPAAAGRSLDFPDADQASDYAREALAWAAEKGILSGYAGGQLAPGETATRAQAAQMLKRFLENT